jgi:hypothetical protein
MPSFAKIYWSGCQFKQAEVCNTGGLVLTEENPSTYCSRKLFERRFVYHKTKTYKDLPVTDTEP